MDNVIASHVGAMAWFIKRIANMAKSKLVNDLAVIGYKIDENLAFNYINKLNKGQQFKARACPIVEIDTGISFAHHAKARRDANFHKLQEYRQRPNPVINGRVYEI
jgi:hypothetical protein